MSEDALCGTIVLRMPIPMFVLGAETGAPTASRLPTSGVSATVRQVLDE